MIISDVAVFLAEVMVFIAIKYIFKRFLMTVKRRNEERGIKTYEV